MRTKPTLVFACAHLTDKRLFEQPNAVTSLLKSWLADTRLASLH